MMIREVEEQKRRLRTTHKTLKRAALKVKKIQSWGARLAESRERSRLLQTISHSIHDVAEIADANEAQTQGSSGEDDISSTSQKMNRDALLVQCQHFGLD